jgi:hypothetical protein
MLSDVQCLAERIHATYRRFPATAAVAKIVYSEVFDCTIRRSRLLKTQPSRNE